jgi:hypothetical protein
MSSVTVRLLGQVALGNALQLVHQPENRGLVRVVDALGFLLLRLGLETPALRHRGPLALAHARAGRTRPAPPITTTSADSTRKATGQRAEAGLAAELLLDDFETFAQRFAVGHDRSLRLARGGQAPAAC